MRLIKNLISHISILCTIPILCIILSCSDSLTEKVRIKFEVLPERENLYFITWIDTLGHAEGYRENFIKRPRETWCVITNSENDTLGRYTGLSTAQIFAYFETSDSVVFINFMTGLNLFPDKYLNENEMDKYPLRYEPIRFNLSEIRKEMNVELKILSNG